MIVLKLLDKVSLGIFGTSVLPDMKGAFSFIYYPLKSGANSVSPIAALTAGIILTVIVFLFVRFTGRQTKERKYNTWDCGFRNLNSRMQYSATGFSKPLRIVLRAIFRPTRELQIEEGSSPYYPKSMHYVVTTQSVFEKYLYIPLTTFFARSTKKVRGAVQTGSIHTYLIYIFITTAAFLLYYGLN
jgi:hypothetical protein